MQRQFDDVLLGSIELFCLAAETHSFSAAAVAAGITPAAVSRSIARLEKRLGTRLFVRTTRQIRLTEAGAAYVEQCRHALGLLVEAERQLAGQQQHAAGMLRISLPTTYGHYRILPLLPAFRARHPSVEFEVHLSNRNIDFADEGYDLAVRVRALPDSTLVVRHLEDAALVLVAAPDYLDRAGWPQTLDDLRRHDCIQFELPSNGKPISWLFNEQGKNLDIPTSGAYRCTDDVLGGVTLARSGAGLFQTYRFIVEQDLQQGRLLEILPGYGGRSRPFSLLYPQARHVPFKVRALVDFLLEQLSDK